MKSSITLEVCVADPQSLVAAIAGGADRIELCSALELGGLTPLPSMLALAAKAPVPVYAMVRPRTGDFVFDAADLDAMRRDIDAIRAAGLTGVVIGANRRNGALDTELLAKLVQHGEGLGTTLHRAIDLVPDLAAATEEAVQLGVVRILTSGGAQSAPEGIDTIAEMVRVAAGRVSIMAGSGVQPANVAALLSVTKVDEVHSTCRGAALASTSGAVRLGFAEAERQGTDADVVAAFKRQLAAFSRQSS